MKRPSKNAPNRFAENKNHALYGIWNYLENKGITDSNSKDIVISGFLKTQGFIAPKKKVQQAQNQFIQNRFGEFSKHVNSKDRCVMCGLVGLKSENLCETCFTNLP